MTLRGTNLTTLDYADPLRRGHERRMERARSANAGVTEVEESDVSKKTKKRKLRARRNKANHGKRPNVGRR